VDGIVDINEALQAAGDERLPIIFLRPKKNSAPMRMLERHHR
jgi:hypothetical protein